MDHYISHVKWDMEFSVGWPRGMVSCGMWHPVKW